MKKTKYYITTWDTEKQDFTPQRGVRTGPYTLFGLRKAIRKLRELGYPCDYSSKGDGDPSVRIEASDWAEKIEASFRKQGLLS